MIEKENFETWHHRLGHLNELAIDISAYDERIVVTDPCKNKIIYELCIITKNHKFPHFSRSTTYEVPLSLIFGNVWGLSTIFSGHGFLYYLNIVDAVTNYNWIWLLQKKFNVMQLFSICLQKNRLNIQLKCSKQTTPKSLSTSI